MKQLKTLLTLITLSVCSVQCAWARIAPALPEAQTPANGQYYYLYNVMEGKFLCKSTTNTSYAGLGTYGDKVLFIATEEESGYMIRWADNNYLLQAYDTYITSSSSASGWRDYFIFAESSKGYTIQRSTMNKNYYKADEYVGFNGSNGDRLSPALSEGSIHWLLFSAEDAEYYFAKHKLFTNLEVADQYNFYVTQYEQVYENPASTTAELDFAQATLQNALDLSRNYVSPSWTEYPILFQNTTDNKWTLYNSNQYLRWNISKGSNSALETTSTLKATVNVDADATLCYTYSGDSYATMRVYLDGELKQIIYPNQSTSRRYYIEVTAGKHDVTWTCLVNDARTNSGYSHDYLLSGIGIMNTPTIITATTTVEGQLGTEVLKLVDPVSSVKKIVINGVIGADDWKTIGLMVNALSIDMSGATATAPMPASMFTKSKFDFLHDVKLPQGLTAIGRNAFYDSDVENEMTFPESLQEIGDGAFSHSKIKAAYMPNGVKLVNTGYTGSHFAGCDYLKNVTFPSSTTVIPEYCFYSCKNLRTFTIPEGVTEIGEFAFQYCQQFNPRFPSTIKLISICAFESTATDSLFVNENATVGAYAFRNCNNLVYAEWPTTFVYVYDSGSSSNSTSMVVYNCPKLKKVKLKSPTVVTYNQRSFLSGNTLGNITLLVPDFLVNAYKLDPYWYQCNVQGFNSAEQKDWILTRSLVLNEGQRIGGTPNIDMQQQSTLTFNGDTPQILGNITFSKDWYNTGNWNTMILSNTNNVNISGKLVYRSYTPEKKWVFLCLPFDTKVSDITCESSYAIRYYDGAQRANNGVGGNWKNYESDDIIPAGTGFILQTSKQCSTFFTAMDNATKQYMVSNNEFVKALDANLSEVTANKGWNLIGNPWPTYYNIHKLNFTAPITVWNGDTTYPTYVAYSIIDDDYAIKPMEAIFVQCPDEVNSISFPVDGRQLTNVIESQNAVRAREPQTTERRLIDVELSNGQTTDKTRFVLNPQASMDYELSCDASKFFSMDANVSQIYTIEQDVQFAINERPLGDGTVSLGMKIATDGTYTLSASRNQFKRILLVDYETGVETDLTLSSYIFSINAGTNNSRFELRFDGTATDIETIGKSDELQTTTVYDLLGRKVSSETSKLSKGVYIVNGKKVMIQ